MEQTANNQITLSAKEEQILCLMAAGKKSTEIADTMHLSLPAIKWYRQRLKNKFDAATTGELLVKAMASNMI
ncbi:MAG: helix-turn-helix transcriptional regulator [Bacteroidaceae bacterium]|nr:helix-turn-helix transcriptional regulator [Bacteroidaceae bacterium]